MEYYAVIIQNEDGTIWKELQVTMLRGKTKVHNICIMVQFMLKTV